MLRDRDNRDVSTKEAYNEVFERAPPRDLALPVDFPPSPKSGWWLDIIEHQLGAMPGSFLIGRHFGALEPLRTQITT